MSFDLRLDQAKIAVIDLSIRRFAKPNGVIYDVQYVLLAGESDGRV